MNIPTTHFNYSKQTEAFRIGYVASRIRMGFYQKKGFSVLPYNTEDHAEIIYFPHLEYDKIPHFWEVINKDIKTLAKESEIIQEIEKLMSFTPLSYNRLESKWREKELVFWEVMLQFLPGLFSTIKSIEIRPTRFGGKISTIPFLEKNDDTIAIYVREDADLSKIVEGLLMDRCFREPSLKNYTWEEKRAIIDFLLTKTMIADMFPDHKSTLYMIRLEQRARYVLDSQKYMADLGLQFKGIFTLKNDGIHAQDKLLPLTKNESTILNILIVNKNKIVTFDTIADELWQENSDTRFSLSAITKLIERIRKKIYDTGIHTEIIHTQKGQGYVLKD